MNERTTPASIGRRDFLGRIAGGLGTLAFAPSARGAESSPSAAAASRPNIIMFLVDDEDKPSIGAYGGKTWTPNLDQMAREGMRFDQNYVSTAVCTPSRYSFLTGRYPGNSYSKVYIDACGGEDTQGFPSFNVALESDRMNVGAVLNQAGYVTGFVGKYHLASKLDQPEFFEGDDGLVEIPKDPPMEAGPETSAIFRRNERAMRRYLQAMGFSWAKNIYFENLQAPYAEHNPEWTIQAALEFIEANKDRPFYLHCCTTLLHGGPNSWRKSMDYPLVSGEGELDALPAVMTPRAELLDTLKKNGFDPDGPTAGEAWLDDAFGAILKKLKALGIGDNTLVIYTSDNGRDGKGSLFTINGLCLPCIARWPKRISAGSICDELVQNVDWAPTFFELAGAQVPKEYRMDGRSLAPLLDNGKVEAWRDHLYFEIGYARAVATKEWKYIAVRYPRERIEEIQKAKPERLPRLMSYIGRVGIGTRGAEHSGFFDEDQLYDLRNDPEEKANLARDPKRAAQLETMRRMLMEHLQRTGRPFGEFIPGGNAAPAGQIDKQIETVKTLKIEGKEVIVPGEEDAGDGEAPGTKAAGAPPKTAAGAKSRADERAKVREQRKAERAQSKNPGAKK
ncbi:MAG: sulfatase-like hydrolase/transferase [Candidatus Sumerlaeota bacterium]|nr:sulfatase-like hydrolase/transferase [Candidatus Sumerlaeota bacterium]